MTKQHRATIGTSENTKLIYTSQILSHVFASVNDSVCLDFSGTEDIWITRKMWFWHASVQQSLAGCYRVFEVSYLCSWVVALCINVNPSQSASSRTEKKTLQILQKKLFVVSLFRKELKSFMEDMNTFAKYLNHMTDRLFFFPPSSILFMNNAAYSAT